MRFFTADLHLGHTNIIRYCHRPFDSVAEMNESLVANWNATVGPDDEVWVLGDVALGPIRESLAIVDRLSGHKVLITGNHDRCWAGNGESADKWIDRYVRAGFADVRQGTVATTIGDTPVLAGHFPYEGDSHDEDRFTRWRPEDRGGWLLHGHVHTKWQVNARQINVGVDVWDLAPVSETSIAQIIHAR
ncbi:MAG: metallophosphoesterase [Actinobacteria bacterium]|nr:metallophosphoesterase [Actinomycetota bacterium]